VRISREETAVVLRRVEGGSLTFMMEILIFIKVPARLSSQRVRQR